MPRSCFGVIRKTFFVLSGWPDDDISDDQVSKAIRVFEIFGKTLLMCPRGLSRKHNLNILYSIMSKIIDVCLIGTIIKLTICCFTSDLELKVFLGDIFIGLPNETPSRILGLVVVYSLGFCRSMSYNLDINNRLEWLKIIHQANSKGFTPQVLGIDADRCRKFRKQVVFIVRQIPIGGPMNGLFWAAAPLLLIYQCPLAGQIEHLQRNQLICIAPTLLLFAVAVPGVLWIALLFVILVLYLNHRASSIYDAGQQLCKYKQITVGKARILCYYQNTALNELDQISSQLRWIFYHVYYVTTFSADYGVLMCLSYPFESEIINKSMLALSIQTILFVALVSYMAGQLLHKIEISYSIYHIIYQNNVHHPIKAKLKMNTLMDRFIGPCNGLWVGHSYAMDNYHFIIFLAENCCTMFLLTNNLRSLSQS